MARLKCPATSRNGGTYVATICRDLGAEFVRAGGVTDHIHIVTTLPRTASQANLVEQIKKVSSKWIKALDARYRGFFWQRGYGAFSSMSPSQLKAVLEYAQAQREHHRTRSLQEEYRKFKGRDHPPSPSYGGTSRSRLQRSPEIDFDKRYVWG